MSIKESCDIIFIIKIKSIYQGVLMKKVLLILFVIFLTVTSLFSLSLTLDSEKLKKSEVLVNKVLDFMTKNDFTDEKIKNFIYQKNEYSPIRMDNPETGFGLNRIIEIKQAAYLYAKIIYLSYEDTPCYIEIQLYGQLMLPAVERINKNTSDRLKKYAVLKKDIDDNYYYSISHTLAGYGSYKKNKEKLVGKTKKIKIPDEYQIYYDYLYTSKNIIDYGERGGITGIKPDGRRTMEKLLELNNPDIFINIMKGENPSGRMYGAEGLLRLENSQKNIDIINEIFAPLIKEKIKYRCIDGCLIYTQEYQKYRYDKDYVFPPITNDPPPAYEDDVPPLEFELNLNDYDDYPLKDYDYSDNDKMVPLIILPNPVE